MTTDILALQELPSTDQDDERATSPATDPNRAFRPVCTICSIPSHPTEVTV